MSYQDFKNQALGKGFDIDRAFGNQCWDGYARYCQYLGVPYANCTVTGYVRDIWEQRGRNGMLNHFDEVSVMQPGDIAVFKESQYTPYSHIAIFDSDAGNGWGYFLGQNQGAVNGVFNIVKLPYSATYDTAFRKKGTTQPKAQPQTKPQTTNAKYTNSSLVSYTKLSPNHSGQRTHNIDRITPHCVVGQCSVKTLGDVFAPSSRQASSNYGIGVDGKVGMYVEEKNRSWCSSNVENDQRAVTIECASDTVHPYTMNAKVYESLIALCVDICKRNGKTKLIWFGDRNKSLSYQPKSNEMVLTVHRWFANKSCPGDWLYSRLGDLANKVNERLNATTQTQSTQNSQKSSVNVLYRVRKAWGQPNTQKGAFKSLDNAKKCCKENVGYSVFDDKGNVVYTNTPKKSVDELAREVIAGKWGVGQDRVNRLTKAGYDYNTIQKRVNEMLK